MLTAQQIEERVLEFLHKEVLEPEVTIGRQDDLLTGEVLDSIGAIRLAAFLEKQFEIDMQASGFVVENFQNVEVLARYVLRSVQGGGESSAGA
jgi:acyl carrier protein